MYERMRTASGALLAACYDDTVKPVERVSIWKPLATGMALNATAWSKGGFKAEAKGGGWIK
jgi:hypothetical protein